MDSIKLFFDKIKLVFLLGKNVEFHVEEGVNIKAKVLWVSSHGMAKLSNGSQVYFKKLKKYNNGK